MFSDVTVDPGTGMVQLRILFPNPEGELLPGLFVRARVEQSRQESAITIPQQSVVRNPDGSTFVWTVDVDNTVKIRNITLSKPLVINGCGGGACSGRPGGYPGEFRRSVPWQRLPPWKINHPIVDNRITICPVFL